MKKTLIIIGIVVVIVGLTISRTNVLSQQAPEVVLESAENRVIRSSILASGTLTHEEEVNLTTEVIGRVTEVYVEEAVAVFFNILLYMSLLMVAAPAMAAVNEEKVSRVVEVVLSSVSPAELMAGKIIGSAIAGFTQMFIWLIPVVLVASGSVPLLLAFNDLEIQLSFLILIYFLFNYLFGVVTFLSIFSAFGAMFDSPQDAQSSMFPVMLLIIVPFFLAFSVVNNPTSMLGVVGSMLPFFSILVMPARMVLIDVPFWQFLVAVLVNLATLYFVVLLCGKIYRFTILMTGKNPSWKEIYKWMRYS